MTIKLRTLTVTRFTTGAALAATLLLGACQSTPETVTPASTTWYPAQLMQSAGVRDAVVMKEGNPGIAESPLGSAVAFDGDGDRLLVNANPLFGAEEFTIEAIFKANDVYPANAEPRFFHIESADNPNRRFTMELRLNDRQQWYLDAYIKSDEDKMTLIDPTLVHPIEQWAHAAVTYKDGQFTSYVNGKKELSARVQYLPIAANAKASIGARMNRVHWFNGAIYKLKVTQKALNAEDFELLP